MKKWLPIVLFVAILALAVFLRLFLLGLVPAGLTNDEANLGYDSYSLLMTGKDQWGHVLPLVFKGFGDYPAPFYRYIAVVGIYFFGLSAFAIRFPSAIFGILSVICTFFLVKRFFNTQAAYVAMFFLGISPWAIAVSRTALEVSAAMFLILCALLCFAYVKKGIIFLLGMSLFLALTLYTYSAYTLFTPVLLVILLTYLFVKKQVSLKRIAVAVILFLFFLMPLLLTRSSTAAVRFSQVGIFSNITSIGLVGNLNDQRGACLHYVPSPICKLADNKIVLFSSDFIANYLNHFSPNFLSISGTTTQFSVLPEGGLEYLFSFVLLLIGMVALAKGNLAQKVFLLFLLLSPIPDSLTGNGNYIRAFLMVPFLIIAESYGLYWIIKWCKTIQWMSFQSIAYLLIAVIFIGSIASFSLSYFTYFRDNYSRYSQYGYEPLMQYVQSQKDKYDKIYITTVLNDAKQYVYYLFYTQYSPALYESKKDVSYHVNPDGWISIDRIDNIYFVDRIDSKYLKPGVLLISHPTDFPQSCKANTYITDRIGYKMFEVIPATTLLSCYLQQKNNL